MNSFYNIYYIFIHLYNTCNICLSYITEYILLILINKKEEIMNLEGVGGVEGVRGVGMISVPGEMSRQGKDSLNAPGLNWDLTSLLGSR